MKATRPETEVMKFDNKDFEADCINSIDMVFCPRMLKEVTTDRALDVALNNQYGLGEPRIISCDRTRSLFMEILRSNE